MADVLGFDINTALTPRPWGPREETMVTELIQTLVNGTLTGAKRTAGHLHNLLYSEETVQAVRAYLEPLDNSHRIIAGSHNNGHTFTSFLPEDIEGGKGPGAHHKGGLTGPRGISAFSTTRMFVVLSSVSRPVCLVLVRSSW